jgi:hypothetical protein
VGLAAVEVSLFVPGSDPPALAGLEAFRDGRVVHAVAAVKSAGSGLPFGVSEDVFDLVEPAQGHRSGPLADRLLNEADLDGGWVGAEAGVLDCS